jgi:uncharacterized protein YfcZ (UPF0381/DUF406 family)
MQINTIQQTDVTPKVSKVQADQTQDSQPLKAPAEVAKTTSADTVQISLTAKAMMQEVNETAAQTAQEAGRGDMQARRLLERRAEAKGATQKNISELV